MFSFGAPQQQTQQTPFGSSGGGAFGQTPLQTPGLGGTTAMGFGGFGQTPATSAPAGPGGLFGGGATATPGTGLFGQAPKMTTTAPTPGLFGQALFGATPATSAATPGLFGQTPAFGATPGGLFGAAPTMAAPAAPTGQLFSLAQQQQQPIQLSLQDHLSNLAGAWNPASPACQFKHYFYNMVHPSQVSMYRPGPGQDVALYERAQENNPDPSCMVPVLATGFEDLKRRIESQEGQTGAHKGKLSDIQEDLLALERQHHLVTSVKLQEYKRRLTAVVHKVLRLMKAIQLLRNSGYSVRAEEETLKARMESLEKELSKSAVFRGRLLEMTTQVRALRDNVSSQQQRPESSGSVSESSLHAVFEALKGQQDGLSHVMDIVKADQKKTGLVMRAYSETLGSFRK